MHINWIAIIGSLAALTNLTSACCSSGCYCVKANSYRNAGCRGIIDGHTAFANYGSTSPCTDIRNAASINGNNDGCGSSNCDIHFYKTLEGCKAHPNGGFGFVVKKAVNSGRCIRKPDGATYMRSVCN